MPGSLQGNSEFDGYVHKLSDFGSFQGIYNEYPRQKKVQVYNRRTFALK